MDTLSNLLNRWQQLPVWLQYTLGALVLLKVLWQACNWPARKCTRAVPKKGTSAPLPATGERHYIEGAVPVPDNLKVPVSCSFVEFDGVGEFLDFQQQVEAYQKVDELAEQSPVLLVFYCHGWRHNAQSGDVVNFNHFLGRLAKTSAVRDAGLRVHGVYFSWRGNPFRPCVETNSKAYQDTKEWFGGPLVSARHQRWLRQPWSMLEIFSYWSRKKAAEHQVSGVSMARTLFVCANMMRQAKHGLESRAVVIGHSFGALMLERSLGQASVGLLSVDVARNSSERTAPATEAVPEPQSSPAAAPQQAGHGRATLNPLDLILFVNSAAPSIYAHMLHGFLAAYRQGLTAHDHPLKEAPVVVSITSTADWCTQWAHRVANCLCFLSPQLRRRLPDLLKLERGDKDPGVWESFFYERTPGHNPLLVNHWIVPDEAPPQPAPEASPDAVMAHNLASSSADTLSFCTCEPGQPPEVRRWVVASGPPPDQEQWALYKGHHRKYWRSAYWIVRCDKPLIGGHNDVWSPKAMEMYAAIYRLVELRKEQ